MELSERYLYYRYGVTMPISTNGAQVVDHYASRYPQSFSATGNGTAGSAPVQGDVLSFSNSPSFNDFGHTAVVQASTVNSAGNGTVTIVEQNSRWSTSGSRTLTVAGWSVRDDFSYTKWLHRIGPSSGPAQSGGGDTATMATSDGHIQVFSTTGGNLRENWYDPRGGAIGGWVNPTGAPAGATGTPALVARAGQPVIDAFVRGNNGQVYETWYNWATGNWGGWISLGGSMTSNPTAIATSDGHDQVFGTNGTTAVQNWFSPSGAIGGWRSF